MKLDKLVNGVNILQKYSDCVEIVPVPKACLFSSAPDFSTQAYIIIEVPFKNYPLDQNDYDELIANGWREECEGEAWSLGLV